MVAKRIRTSSDVYNLRDNEYWKQKYSMPTPEEFAKIDHEVCKVLAISDQIDLNIKLIVCAECAGAGDCSCHGGNLVFHKNSTGHARWYRR